jgi:hypothetical protein
MLLVQADASHAQPIALAVPMEKWLIWVDTNDWVYSPPDIASRGTGIVGIFLREDGTALKVRGAIYESTNDVPPQPTLSVGDGYRVEVGRWQITADSTAVVINLKVAALEKSIGAQIGDESKLEFRVNGQHLVDDKSWFVPAAAVYPSTHESLEKQLLARCCCASVVVRVVPECRQSGCQ